jgi:hypothetical protein
VFASLLGLVAFATTLGLFWRPRTGRVRGIANGGTVIDVSEFAADAVAGRGATLLQFSTTFILESGGVVRARIGGAPKRAEISVELERVLLLVIIGLSLAIATSPLPTIAQRAVEPGYRALRRAHRHCVAALRSAVRPGHPRCDGIHRRLSQLGVRLLRWVPDLPAARRPLRGRMGSARGIGPGDLLCRA